MVKVRDVIKAIDKRTLKGRRDMEQSEQYQGYTIVYAQDGAVWGAWVEDVPGTCVSVGPSQEEVRPRIHDALAAPLDAIARDRTERPWLYQQVQA